MHVLELINPKTTNIKNVLELGYSGGYLRRAYSHMLNCHWCDYLVHAKLGVCSLHLNNSRSAKELCLRTCDYLVGSRHPQMM